MSNPFFGEIRVVSFGFAPNGWALCNGQLLPINQNQALFSLLGTTYGGDGIHNFALPNLQGRVPIHMGAGFTQGQSGGEDAHTLSIQEMPTHTHTPAGSSVLASQPSAVGHVWGSNASNPYSNGAGNTVMNPTTVSNTGGSQAHENRSPFLVLNFVIALQGIFPSQN